MFRIILIAAMLLTLAIPALAKDDRGMAVRPVAPTGETVKGEQWLLTIGIDTYLSWPRLKTAVNDAKALKSILMERYTFDKGHVIELYDENATRKNILGALRDLTKKIKSEDSLLIFYAGHGHLDTITKDGSWIPVESGTDDPSAWISNHDIKNYLSIDAIKAKHILLVSDSCFSGDFFRGQRGALPEVTDTVIKKAYKLSSRQAITSGGLEPVSDTGFGGNSVFSHFLVAALKSNTNPYLIPSELFPAVKSGVAQNAEQFPQMGSLYGVGGQEGGEMVLFLKQENRLQGLSADSQARQKELDQLKKVELEATAAKQKEQAEITKRERDLAALDQQIAEMKKRLGTSAARSSDSLDNIIAMAEQKEQQGIRLEELRQQREAEERKRQGEIKQLKREAKAKQAENVKSDLTKYEKVASSKYAKDMKGAAWRALVADYPEAKKVKAGDVKGLLTSLGLTRDNEDIVTLEQKKLRDEQRRVEEKQLAEQRRVEAQRIAEERRKHEEKVKNTHDNFYFKNDAVVVDELTSLMWVRNGNIAGKKMKWKEASNWVQNLNYDGYSDWRLPTKEELYSFAKRGGSFPSEWFNANGFNNVQGPGCWYWCYSEYSNPAAFIVTMSNGAPSGDNKEELDYVWPVRNVTDTD